MGSAPQQETSIEKEAVTWLKSDPTGEARVLRACAYGPRFLHCPLGCPWHLPRTLGKPSRSWLDAQMLPKRQTGPQHEKPQLFLALAPAEAMTPEPCVVPVGAAVTGDPA